MAEQTANRPFAFWALYAGLGLLVLFVQLLPLETAPRRWAAPDYMMCLAYAWVLRRPDAVPPLLVALVVLLADFLMQRPPGLWAAFVVIGLEVLRGRAIFMRGGTFMLEWFTVIIVVGLLVVAHRLALMLFLLEPAPLGLDASLFLSTAFAYPVAVAASHFVFGVRKAAPGEYDPVEAR